MRVMRQLHLVGTKVGAPMATITAAVPTSTRRRPRRGRRRFGMPWVAIKPRPVSGARGLISTSTIGSRHLDIRIAITRGRTADRLGRGRHDRDGWLEEADARARDAEGCQDQPHHRERDDHSQEPAGGGGPCCVLERPEHPHPWRAFGDVPGEMDQQPGRRAGEYRAMPTAQSRRHADHEHGGEGMRDGPLIRVSEPEVERYVIQIDGNGGDKTCDIVTTRRVDEAGQSEQTQRSGGQVGDFVERAAGQDAERNPADRPRRRPARPPPAVSEPPTT